MAELALPVAVTRSPIPATIREPSASQARPAWRAPREGRCFASWAPQGRLAARTAAGTGQRSTDGVNDRTGVANGVVALQTAEATGRGPMGRLSGWRQGT
ncbi:MAG: hypothetical protein ER33_00890 [Cyanobium sp. CACIAM 14]|nr:MAG: hypothetical protein ER33_00890 [Cyanobium sp. CACIAM 14]